jgi:hypothetical protein
MWKPLSRRPRAALRLSGVLALAALLGPHVAQAQGADPARMSAASQTAQQAPSCKKLGDFYWEIGDGTGVLGSGQIGSDYGPNTKIKIASASKWVFGAYFLQKVAQPTAGQVQELEMQSGHTKFNPVKCVFSRSVEGCFTAGSNAEVEPQNIGHFSYGGGHSQKLALEIGLGGMNSSALTQEIMGTLGLSGLSYGHPQLAGGLEGTPEAYAGFLRKVVSGQLRMKQYLDYAPVCTMPGYCPGAVYSPAKAPWHYSLDHWIEDDPGGDGAFSSPGAFGFYPWIAADKSTYGVLAREKMSSGAYLDSVDCGVLIRKAWFSKSPQLR